MRISDDILGTYKTLTGEYKYTNLPFSGKVLTRDSDDDYLRFNISRSVEELAQDLELSGSLSAAYAGYQGSDKADFIKKCSVSSETTFISIYCSYRNKIKELIGNISWDASEELTPKEIYERSGDSYVTSISTGAEFIAVYSLATQTEQEQTSLVNDLSASGITDGVNLSADFQTKLDEMHSKYNLSISFQEKTFGVPGWDGKNSLVEFALNFAKYARKQGGGNHTFKETFESLYTLADDATQRDGLEAISSNIQKISEEDPWSSKQSLSKLNIQVVANLNQTQSLFDIYTFYNANPEFLEDLAINKEKLETARSAISKIVENFNSDPASPIEPSTFPVIDDTIPDLRFEVSQSSGYGNPGGSPFDVTDVGGSRAILILACCHISKIQTWAGEDINKLTLTYSFTKGEDVKKEYGGNGGTDLGRFDIDQGNWISGTAMWFHKGSGAGGLLAQLKVETTSGAAYNAGQDPHSGNYVGLPIDIAGGWRLLGYSGRAGSKVDILYPVQFRLLKPVFL